MPKNVQPTAQLYSSHMLARICSKSSKLGFSSKWTEIFQMYKQDLEKAKGSGIKLKTSTGSLKSKRVPEKYLLLLYWLCQSFWLCGSQQSVENSERDGIPGHFTCFLRNLYAGQEATARTGHGTTDWFQIGKGVRQGCILSPCLFNLYAEYIVWNARLDEAQVGIKIARKNINNLIYALNTTLMAESEEELKSLLMKVKEESETVGLNLNIYKTKITPSGPSTSWQKEGEKSGNSEGFYFLEL